MSELKTNPQKHDVLKFLKSVDNDQRRQDALRILELMQQVTRREAVM